MNTNRGTYLAPLKELMTNSKQCGGDLAYRSGVTLLVNWCY